MVIFYYIQSNSEVGDDTRTPVFKVARLVFIPTTSVRISLYWWGRPESREKRKEKGAVSTTVYNVV